MSDPANTGPDPGNQDGQGSGDRSSEWITGLNLDDQTRQAISKFDGAEALAKSYVQLESKLGKTAQFPGEGATEEEWLAFFNKAGRPESPDGYQLQMPGLPEGMKADEEFFSKFKEAAHRSGLTSRQARSLFDWYNRYTGDRYQTERTARQTETKQVMDKLKAEVPDFENELNLTRRLVDHVGGQDFKDWLNKTGFGNDPQAFHFLNKLAHMVGEDVFEEGEPAGGGERESGVFDYDKMRSIKKVINEA